MCHFYEWKFRVYLAFPEMFIKSDIQVFLYTYMYETEILNLCHLEKSGDVKIVKGLENVVN